MCNLKVTEEHMQAITTKYHGATATKPSRISATSGSGHRVTVSSDSVNGDHAAVARALCEKLKWTGHYAGGSTKTGSVFVFVGE